MTSIRFPGKIRSHRLPWLTFVFLERVARRMIDSTGVRDGLRWAADLQPLAFHSKSSKEYTRALQSEGVAKGIDDLRK